MNKFVYVFIGVFLIFCSCAPASELSIAFDSSIAVQDWNGVSVNIAENICIQDNLMIAIEVENFSKFYLHYGVRWQLERYDFDGSISLCKYQSQPFFTQSLQTLPPDCSTKHTIDFSCYGKSLKKGHYRIVFGPIGALDTDIEHLERDDEPSEIFLLYKDFVIE